MLRDAAVLALPEVDEAEHLISFLTLPDVGVRVAEHMAVGILSQEGEDAGLPATSLRQIMGLDEGMLAEIRHGVEIEVEIFTGEQRVSGEPCVP